MKMVLIITAAKTLERFHPDKAPSNQIWSARRWTGHNRREENSAGRADTGRDTGRADTN